MNRKRLAQIATIATLSAAIGVAIWTRSEQKPATPQDAVYAMLDAARNGDVPKYLACYTGEIAKSLDRARADSPDFSKYLRDSGAALKGIAVMEPQPQPDGLVELRVEYVFGDHNEAQFFFLQKIGSAWKISRVETSERVKTLIPYGTPVQ